MSTRDIRGRRVTVVGGARSGLAVARLLRRHGARVFLTERGAPTEHLQAALDEASVDYEFGGHTARALDADFVVVSPGVPSTANVVQQARRGGLEVYSEIEAASWFCRAPIVAITGTNGKTTTTSLTGHVFRTAGRSVVVGGNIGYPFSDYVDDTGEDDVVVLEVSSFQLDHVDTFRPRVSVLLNITPDHLDRYGGDVEAYARAKFRITARQGEGDTVVYNADDERVSAFVRRAAGHRPFRALAFSREHEPETGAFVRDGRIVLRIHDHEEPLMDTSRLALRGPHNLHNSLAAAVATHVMDIRSEVVRESLASFEGVPHRLEFVRELDGVRYVNDSKATNVNAVWYALESFETPIVLIAGGRDKGNDYAALEALVREKVRAVVALGESADKVARELGDVAGRHAHAASMEDAIHQARGLAHRGDVVLLSPACASFDMFDDYEDRGDTFRRLVNSL